MIIYNFAKKPQLKITDSFPIQEQINVLKMRRLQVRRLQVRLRVLNGPVEFY